MARFYTGVFGESMLGEGWRDDLRDCGVSCYALHETEFGRHIHVIRSKKTDIDDFIVGLEPWEPVRYLPAYIDYLKNDAACIEFFCDSELKELVNEWR